MKIMIFGSSVVINIRPPRMEKSEKIYGDIVIELLRKEINEPVELVNLGRKSNMINSFSINEFNNYLLQHYPDVVIFNYGINECVPRVLPRKLWSFFVEESIKKHPVRRYTYAIILRLTPYLIRLFHCKSWVSVEAFRKEFENRISIINKESSSIIIILGIGMTSDRVERTLPGSYKAIDVYNKCLIDICNKNKNSIFIDCSDLTPFMPDGIHFDSKGHRIVAEKIYSEIIGKI